MINNRQAGRRRGRGGQQQQRPQGGSGRPDNGNRIDNRARGNAAQMLEKYKTLARDAQMQGDRVNVEYYLQFADHYFRVLAETRARFEENGGAVSTRRIQGATLDEDEPDYEDEGERADQPQAEQRPEQNRSDLGRTEQGRTEQARSDQRDDRSRGEQRPQRDQQQRDPQQRGQQNGYRQDGRPDRQDRGEARGYPQTQGAREGQPYAPSEQRNAGREDTGNRMNGDGERYDHDSQERNGQERAIETPRRGRTERQPREARVEQPVDLVQPAELARSVELVQPAESAQPVDIASSHEQVQPSGQGEIVAEAPRRGRGRPRRDAAPVAPVAERAEFEGDTGIADVGFMAERLPPALTVAAKPEAANDSGGGVESNGESGAEPVEKPRRRRGRPPASETGTG